MRSITRALGRAQRTDGLVGGNSQTGTSASSGANILDPELRALTGRLQPLLASRRPAKIFFTACGLGEGATTVAHRLANALAIDGRQVLLCTGKDGIANMTTSDRAGEESGERRILSTSVASLQIVDISDLHRSEVNAGAVIGFQNWLEAQPPWFDVIVVDMPPVLARQSWLSISGMPDGIVLVVEAERTRSMVLKTTATTLQDAGGHILGIVFNKRQRHIPNLFYKRL
jgi:polysaccharide biosynthesis transport protein